MLVETKKRFKLRNGKWVNPGRKLELTVSYASELIKDKKVTPFNEADLSDFIPELNKGEPEQEDETPNED